MICIVGVALIGTFWSWRIRRKYPRAQDAEIEATPVIA
jgi:hypothetical protein